jgi:hypothetical protein
MKAGVVVLIAAALAAPFSLVAGAPFDLYRTLVRGG